MRQLICCMLLGAIGVAVCPTAYPADPHFYGITSPGNVVGERRTWAIVDLKGAPAANVKVYVSYGTSSAEATTSGASAIYADARCSPHETGKLKCYVVFPHYSKSSGWNPYDRNPKRITAGTRTYYRWAKEVRPTGSTSAITINDTVRSFIMPRRLTIGVFGDSYASGEGAPYGSSRWMGAGGPEEGCHRSYYSGHYRGVSDWVRANPGIDTHWRFYACSGAEVLNGIFNRQSNDDGTFPTARSQLSWHKQWIDGYNYPRLDVAIVSIGGNDMGFIDVAVECLTNNIRGGCNNSASINNFINQNLGALYRVSNGNRYGWYTELDQRLKSELGVRRVIVTEYPDVSRDANANFCNLPLVALQRPDCAGSAEVFMSQEEAQWVYQDVLVKLNRKVKEAASGLGWVVAGDSNIAANGALGSNSGNMALSRTRGLCNCDAGYFNTVRQALVKYAEVSNAWHPNSRGYYYTYRRTILDALNRHVSPTGARYEYPTMVTATLTLSRGLEDDVPYPSMAATDIEQREQGAFIDEYPGDQVMTRAAGGEKGPPIDVIDQETDATDSAKVKHQVKELAAEEAQYQAQVSGEPKEEKPGKPDPNAVKRAEAAEKQRGQRPTRGRPDWAGVPAQERQAMEQHQAAKQAAFAEIARLKDSPQGNAKQGQ